MKKHGLTSLLIATALAGAVTFAPIAQASEISDFLDGAAEWFTPSGTSAPSDDGLGKTELPTKAAAAAPEEPATTQEAVKEASGNPAEDQAATPDLNAMQEEPLTDAIKNEIDPTKPKRELPPSVIAAEDKPEPKTEDTAEKNIEEKAEIKEDAKPVELIPAEAPKQELLASQSAPDATLNTAQSPADTLEADKQLKAALEYVYANNPQIRAQREALKAVDESVALAVSGFRPNAAAGYSKGRERTTNAIDRWQYSNTDSKALLVTQDIFNGGESLASYAAAKQRVKAARAQLSAVEQQILYDAVAAFTDVVEKQAVLALAQNNMDVLKRQLESTQARFDVGELTVTDTSQSEARLAGAQSDERKALGDLEVAKATFKRIIGYEVPESIALPGVPGGLPASLPEAQEWAHAANPVLNAARHNEKAFSKDVDIRTSALLPDVSIEGSMTRGNSSAITGLRNFDNDALVLNVAIPLYQSGAEWARIRESRNLAQQAKFNTLDTNEAVAESTARAWGDYTTAKALITSNDAAVRAAETALTGMRNENEFGTRTIQDVLDAEQEAFFARVNLVRALRAEKLQAYRLLASVGRLTAEELKLQTDVPDPKEHYDSVKYQLIGW